MNLNSVANNAIEWNVTNPSSRIWTMFNRRTPNIGKNNLKEMVANALARVVTDAGNTLLIGIIVMRALNQVIGLWDGLIQARLANLHVYVEQTLYAVEPRGPSVSVDNYYIVGYAVAEHLKNFSFGAPTEKDIATTLAELRKGMMFIRDGLVGDVEFMRETGMAFELAMIEKELQEYESSKRQFAECLRRKHALERSKRAAAAKQKPPPSWARANAKGTTKASVSKPAPSRPKRNNLHLHLTRPDPRTVNYGSRHRHGRGGNRDPQGHGRPLYTLQEDIEILRIWGKREDKTVPQLVEEFIRRRPENQRKEHAVRQHYDKLIKAGETVKSLQARIDAGESYLSVKNAPANSRENSEPRALGGRAKSGGEFVDAAPMGDGWRDASVVDFFGAE